MDSAWRRHHDLAEDACRKCQGSSYVPAAIQGEHMVDECPACGGTGKEATKKAA